MIRETEENCNEFRGALTRVLQISICFKGFQSITINEHKEDTKNNEKSPNLYDQSQLGPALPPPSLVEPEDVAR